MALKRFIPTALHRALVRELAGFGIPEDDISRLIINPQTKSGITPKTLRKHFRDELDTGAVEATSKVARRLFAMATGEGKEAVAAAIFWMKVRAGWVSREGIEVTGKDGGPIRRAVDMTDDELATIATRGRKGTADKASRKG